MSEEIKRGIIEITKSRPTAYQILRYLHSHDVMIKVKCPDCAWGQFFEETVSMTPCYTCNSTGYRIEPLIEVK